MFWFTRLESEQSSDSIADALYYNASDLQVALVSASQMAHTALLTATMGIISSALVERILVRPRSYPLTVTT